MPAVLPAPCNPTSLNSMSGAAIQHVWCGDLRCDGIWYGDLWRDVPCCDALRYKT